MKISFPSPPVHFFNAPEVKSVRAKFNYSFFTPDESVNEDGMPEFDGSLQPRFKREGSVDYKNLNPRIPRFVTLDIEYSDKFLMMDSSKSADNNLRATQKELEAALAEGAIVTETNASSKMFESYTSGNSLIDEEIENLMRVKLNRYLVDGSSPNEALSKLAKTTSVDIRYLSYMLSPKLNDELGRKAHKSISEQGGASSNLRQVGSQAQVNAEFAPMVHRRALERGVSLLESSVTSKFVQSAGFLKRSKTAMKNLGKVRRTNSRDYTFSMPYFREPSAIRDIDNIKASASTVGLLIEKKRIYKGEKYPMPSIVVAGKSPDKIIDTKVAYGQTYEYTIRTLSVFRMPVVTEEGEKLLVTFLVASKKSQPTHVTVKEDRSPSPPSDVNFFYDYETGSLNLFWKPPVNPQRDVKYYQVFRRKSLKDPFELLCMLDFDDSVVRTLPKESIDSSLIKYYPDPRYTFIDTEFTKDSSYIYAVVSVDARRLSSSYSTQVKISFNSAENKIERQLVCRQGAPKQYPNWTKKENFFVDSMKDSDHKKVQIYFDPEVYNFIDSNGTKNQLFLTNTRDRLGKYVFQFINTDRLKEQRFEIKIDDAIFAEGDVSAGRAQVDDMDFSSKSHAKYTFNEKSAKLAQKKSAAAKSFRKKI